MKTTLFVCSLLAGWTFAGLALASVYAAHAHPADKAITANVATAPSPRRLFGSGSECAPDQSSAVFEGGGRLLGYECVSNANGS
jgi:hypothetical protein